MISNIAAYIALALGIWQLGFNMGISRGRREQRRQPEQS